ncbi:MAG: ABC transporter substrate-binding protein [Verrucomicrobiales bacterium]
MNRIFQLSALAAAALLAACGPKDPSDIDAAEGVEQGILILGNGSEPEGLDVHLVTGVPENNILSSLVEGLISYHPTDDNEPFPGVAERWEPNDDFSTWTFHLREDARWSNGDPVAAGDFVYSLQRILEPEFAAPYAGRWFTSSWKTRRRSTKAS